MDPLATLTSQLWTIYAQCMCIIPSSCVHHPFLFAAARSRQTWRGGNLSIVKPCRTNGLSIRGGFLFALPLSLSLRQGGHQPERGNCVARRPFCDCALAHDGPTSQWVQKNENFKYLDTVVGLLRHVLVILTTADETW